MHRMNQAVSVLPGGVPSPTCWNFEHLRAAMGHSDYGMLQRYVRLATERDLGPRDDWLELIAGNPAMEWS